MLVCSLIEKGAWGGEGMKVNAKPKPKPKPKQTKKRGDAHLKGVMLNEKRDKKFLKYKTGRLPGPFTKPEQFEAFNAQPLGREWNTMRTFTEVNRPAVETRQGLVIEPIKRK
jgi:U3 small nucleolar RNA-associated protein 14